ncbi:RraA family protein [Pseudomonas sp. L1(2025)]|uniref:RraA family protein n=1 Tax=Pseudomonas sp. L1(2025) TaxID=3449429 RepID=UPI003F68E587
MINDPRMQLLHTPTLADVLDTFGVWGVIDTRVVPMNDVRGPIFGSAYTVRWSPVRKPRDIMAAQPSTWDDVKNFLAPEITFGRGKIYVGGVDNGLLTELALAGGFSAADFQLRGFEGVILGGAIRDAHVIKQLELPVWATNFTPADTQGNFKVAEAGTACSILGVTIKTGDLIVADASGCVVVPQDLINDVLTRAFEIEQKEKVIFDRVSSGEGLWNVVHDLGRI